MTLFTLPRLTAALWLAVAGTAMADAPVGRGIDPNTFIVGHPASPRWIAAHANHEHPAVLQARLAHQATIDPNTFVVQPPAAVTWVAAPAKPALVAAALR
jgi:hypothetical protein